MKYELPTLLPLTKTCTKTSSACRFLYKYIYLLIIGNFNLYYMRKGFNLLIAAMLISINAVAVPRAEYPRPQFERADWINLNGEWTYELDLVLTGHERNMYKSKGFDAKIIVPFAPESELSGVGHKDFIPSIWYQREINIPAECQERISFLILELSTIHLKYMLTVSLWTDISEVLIHFLWISRIS